MKMIDRFYFRNTKVRETREKRGMGMGKLPCRMETRTKVIIKMESDMAKDFIGLKMGRGTTESIVVAKSMDKVCNITSWQGRVLESSGEFEDIS